MTFDRIDRRILNELQRDGRIANADLAEKIGLSPSACLRRVRALEESGVIDSYVALLDQSRIGRSLEIFVEISLTAQTSEALSRFEDAVARSQEIMECHLMAGDADYLLRIAAADPVDFERIHRDHLTRLPGVSRMRSSFAIRTVSRKTAFPITGD
ncbi:MAG: AsnC family transcriptional regulator [Stappia sp.]|uniref:Lrp/AsnC family transcriptional regulator n=1 Tax=Stappia sp. TaxID=1870903 RepID=UPI000C5AF4E6|nr:winged helix-turn-helix transcriptional regulator [Stappia sp.]MAA97464.1 AsnC family transcriptional regulator [Stappia sp.]MBM21997.1 AsnC family transcriptional regulator [Stappia sp.]